MPNVAGHYSSITPTDLRGHEIPDTSDFWNMKIAALLHDPPAKPWVLHEHQKFAANYLPDPIKDLKVKDVKVGELVGSHHNPGKAVIRTLAFADWCSSAVERPVADLVGKPSGVNFVHPLSGLELGEKHVDIVRNLSEFQVMKIAEKMKHVLQNCIKSSFNLLGEVDTKHVKAVYLMLWRTLENVWWKAVGEVLENEARRLIPPPADTRIPTHTVFDHVESTSALVPCSSSWFKDGTFEDSLNAALISFDVGGVQPLISTSRKTADLWAASWLVSLLGWSALRKACELLGPDAVVFPYLKGIPFVDAWVARKIAEVSGRKSLSEVLKRLLEVEGVSEEEWYEKLMFSLIPPTAVLIVPKHLVGKVEGCLREGLEEGWKKLASIAWNYLAKFGSKVKDGLAECNERWNRQTGRIPVGPIRIVYTEFPEKSEEIEGFLEEHEWMIPKKLYETLEKLMKELRRLGGGKADYSPRPSIVYGAVFTINAAKIASLSREFAREFEMPVEPSPVEEAGAEIKERCNLCGVRNPLFLREKIWEEFAKKGIVEWDRRFDRGEYLCSICLIKRFLPRKEVVKEVLEKIVGLPDDITSKIVEKEGFPSTSDFATALFKHTLAELILNDGIPRERFNELNEKANILMEKIKKFGLETVLSGQPPIIKRDMTEIEKKYGSRLPILNILKLMGEYLDIDTYYRLLQRLPSDEADNLKHVVKDIEEILGKLKEIVERLVKEYAGKVKQNGGEDPLQVKPLSIGIGDTFAVITSDGDYMGEWISGVRLPSFRLSTPPALRKGFGNEYPNLSGMQRILSPAAHVAISRSLLWYAKEVVPRVVEENLGAIVYAGGDDVLAFIPPERAFTVAQRLSEEFMREWDNRSGRIVIGMGHRASCSAGLILAHYMYPLTHAISQMRSLQEDAKNLEEGVHGKGAVKVDFYGRAGPIAMMSKALHWINPWDGKNLDALKEYVTPFCKDSVTWVGVSVFTSGYDLVNEVFGKSKPRFFSPLILADQFGAISRGGVEKLKDMEVGRRCFYELIKHLADLEDFELHPLMALIRLTLSRHIRQREKLPQIAELTSRRLEELGELAKIKSTIEASIVAEHAHEFSLSSLERFKVVS